MVRCGRRPDDARHLPLENFPGIRKLDISFGVATVLIAENASCKCTLLDAVKRVRGLENGSGPTRFCGRNFQRKGTGAGHAPRPSGNGVAGRTTAPAVGAPQPPPLLFGVVRRIVRAALSQDQFASEAG